LNSGRQENKKKTQYFVHYEDKVNYWCDWVSPLLLQNYRKHNVKVKTKNNEMTRPRVGKTFKTDHR